MFAHSRRILDVTEVKEKKLIMGPIEKDTVTTLKVRGRNKDQMYLVRKKSKSPGFVCYTCKSTTICVCDLGRGRSRGIVCIVCQSTTICMCGRGPSRGVVCVVCRSTTICTCGRGPGLRAVCVVCQGTIVRICGKRRGRSQSPAVI